MTKEEELRLALQNLIDSCKPRIRSVANGQRFCVACQASWHHTEPKDRHRDQCPLELAKKALT